MKLATENENPDALVRIAVGWAVDTYSDGVERVTALWATVKGPVSERQLRKVQRLIGRPMSKAQMQEFVID